MEGVVRALLTPEGFNPHAPVEAVIDTDDGQVITVGLFRRMEVDQYYGIAGSHIAFEAYVHEDEPSVIEYARLLYRTEHTTAKPSYTQEQGIVSGTVYNLEGCDFVPGQRAVRLTLDDATYFSKVECIFSTTKEVEQLASIQLGQHVLVRGQVSLRNGRPMAVFGPEITSA